MFLVLLALSLSFSIVAVPVSAQQVQARVDDPGPNISDQPIVTSLSTDKTRYSVFDSIKLDGVITKGSKPVVNQLVTIEVTENNKTLLNSSVISDSHGSFRTSFEVPQAGIATVTVKSRDVFGNTQTVITIAVSNPWIITALAIILPMIIVTVAVFILQSLKHPRIYLAIAIALTILAYYLFYILSDLDSTVKAAFSIALIVPLAAYIYETLAKRRESNAGFEDTVGKYKNESITEDIKNIYNINEELSSHQAAFKTTYDEISSCKLSKSIYTSVKRTGLLGNLPGLRVNRYYSYSETYNNYLDMKLKRDGMLQDSKNYDRFSELFKQMKDAYSSLNQILYINIFYMLGRLQEQHLSYPTTKLPTRYSGPFLLAILRSGMLGEIQEDDKTVWFKNKPDIKYNLKNVYDLIPQITARKDKDSIYSEDNAYILMRFIGPVFESRYEELETKIKVLDEFPTSLKFPKVNKQIVYTRKNTALKIELKGTDPNGKGLTYIIIEKPSNGSISKFNPLKGSLTYTPLPGYLGTDKFLFKASNGILHSNTATIEIGVRLYSMSI